MEQSSAVDKARIRFKIMVMGRNIMLIMGSRPQKATEIPNLLRVAMNQVRITKINTYR